MKLVRLAACALALAFAGTAVAGDPFDDARYYIGIKKNGEALRLIDGGQIDVNLQTSEGYTLLHYAADAGNLAMVEALLERGADPTIKSNSGFTPTSMAMGTMVQARIKKAVDAWGRGDAAAGAAAAAKASAGAGDYDVIRHYIGIKRNEAAIAELDKGIDVNMQTDEGYTLLHHAAEQNNLAMVKELLKRSADPNLRSVKGSTAGDMGYYYKPVLAAIQAAGGKLNLMANAKAPVPMTPVNVTNGGAGITSNSPHAKMCAARHYSSSALCSDSTCKMREYRKWQTCLKTGSYY